MLNNAEMSECTLDMIYGKIAITREDKRRAILYWENQRKIAAAIRDACDSARENEYHRNFIKKHFKYYTCSKRPEFMEPEVKITKNNNIKAYEVLQIKA